MPAAPAALIADLIALGGAGADVVEIAGAEPAAPGPGVVRIGVRRSGAPPEEGLEAFDILLCAEPAAPRPWVGLPSDALEPALAGLVARIEAQPAAAAMCAQVLRMTLALPFEQALVLESLAYSALLGSDGFAAWRAANPPRDRPPDSVGRVTIDVDAQGVRIRLTRPAARNAFDAAMRDELCEALAFALDHPDAPPVTLSGEGPAFSAGGDLDEFGSARDPGLAHLVRTLRAPAGLAHRLGPRLTARLHGACVGAGVEVPAAAGRVTARSGTWFRLPEVAMGLIPGAGGTATIARRIGRQRAAYMALSGADIDFATALAWGLVDEVEP
jgi:enoyl-CoA hydratase/carnithine racemase